MDPSDRDTSMDPSFVAVVVAFRADDDRKDAADLAGDGVVPRNDDSMPSLPLKELAGWTSAETSREEADIS